ncbi:TetR family transcriptional regulator [Asaia krungthepensis]|uniref:TetR family transcriptional regulator n=1 Tax=Asaia krungthepensis NRIC 0535 TaxID=1307925 RepID=A0ABQ0Q3Z9_9PROT|nr:TetR family transcriptional regulator [Asaia krungthepensis]GBQ90264.1 TetR family transcriptional regulator [Asaia krungthepensis NRIC 0535]
MTDIDREEFDLALLEAGFGLAAEKGWQRFSLVEAAQRAGLPIDEVRARFPFRHSFLFRLGRLADESAFRDDGLSGSVRERVFDLFMRRFDVFQQYREGIRAVLQALPTDPALTLLLSAATMDTMRWMAEVAGVECSGFGGMIRLNALAGVWGFALRAWEKDESADLSQTMAALDQALDKAERYGALKPSSGRLMEEAESRTGIADHPLELET